jgi:hypothetical protein
MTFTRGSVSTPKNSKYVSKYSNQNVGNVMNIKSDGRNDKSSPSNYSQSQTPTNDILGLGSDRQDFVLPNYDPPK